MASFAGQLALGFLPDIFSAITSHNYGCDKNDLNQVCNPEDTWVVDDEGNMVQKFPKPGQYAQSSDGVMIKVPPEGYQAIREIIQKGTKAFQLEPTKNLPGNVPAIEFAPENIPDVQDKPEESVVIENEASPKDRLERRRRRQRRGQRRDGDPPGTTREIIKQGNGYRVERVCVPKYVSS
jgi:hypothetical protein